MSCDFDQALADQHIYIFQPHQKPPSGSPVGTGWLGALPGQCLCPRPSEVTFPSQTVMSFTESLRVKPTHSVNPILTFRVPSHEVYHSSFSPIPSPALRHLLYTSFGCGTETWCRFNRVTGIHLLQ